MQCNTCGYENPAEGTIDGRCDQCGTFGFAIVGLPPEDAPVFERAGLGDRWLAQFLDGVIALGLMLVPIFVVGALEGGKGEAETSTIGIIITSIGLFSGLMYLLFADGLRGGQSYGKRVVRIAVVHGQTLKYCTFGQSFFRNAPLLVLGWLDWIFIVGKNRQRLGDVVARTIVIKQPRR
jgi:uncharacterized RDD family membrane protein YckC